MDYLEKNISFYIYCRLAFLGILEKDLLKVSYLGNIASIYYSISPSKILLKDLSPRNPTF